MTWIERSNERTANVQLKDCELELRTEKHPGSEIPDISLIALAIASCFCLPVVPIFLPIWDRKMLLLFFISRPTRKTRAVVWTPPDLSTPSRRVRKNGNGPSALFFPTGKT